MGRLHHFSRKEGPFGPVPATAVRAILFPMRHAQEPMELLQAFERSGDGVYAVNFDQKIVFWNQTAERLLGFKAEDVLGRECFDVIAGGDHLGHPFCGADCPVIECARHGRAPENYDVHTRAASGKPRWINVSIVVLVGRLERSTLTVHLFRDITEQRRKEMRMRRELSRLPASEELDDEQRAGSRLTRRETEVLELMATGLSTARIADVLSVSRTTVRNHIEHLLAKLSVHSKLEAVVYAARHRLV